MTVECECVCVFILRVCNANKKVLSWENAHLPRCHELGTRAASSLCHRMFALLRRSHTLWRLRDTCMMRLVLYMHNANHRMNACHPTPSKRGLASGVKTSGKSCRTIRMLHERATRSLLCLRWRIASICTYSPSTAIRQAAQKQLWPGTLNLNTL